MAKRRRRPWEKIEEDYHVWLYNRITKTTCPKCAQVVKREPGELERMDKMKELVAKHLKGVKL